jgi:hypothetical protein
MIENGAVYRLEEMEFSTFSKLWRILIMAYLVISGIMLPLNCASTHYVHKDKAALYGGIDGYIRNRAIVYQETLKVDGMKGEYFELRPK